MDEGDFSEGRVSNKRICEVLKISMRTIDRVKKKLVEGGIDMALERDKGSRSEPPQGYAKWSLRMLADKMVELQHIDSISHVSVEKV